MLRLSEANIDELSKYFTGKNFEERAILLNKIFTIGLRLLVSSQV